MSRAAYCVHAVCVLFLVSSAPVSGGESSLVPVEAAPESGARVFLLGADERTADNIYGEQPYSDNTGRWIAVRYYSEADRPGGISIVDLTDGSRRNVLVGDPRFPAFHAWGAYLYYQEKVEGKLMLRRCRYETLAIEDVAPLPGAMGSFSYGTVSPDLRWYAVSIQVKPEEPSKVFLLDLRTGAWSPLLDKPGYHAKHEQFSRDGRNRVLIQLNKIPDVKEVLLGELDVTGRELLFPATAPGLRARPGHEAWFGEPRDILLHRRGFHGAGISGARKRRRTNPRGYTPARNVSTCHVSRSASTGSGHVGRGRAVFIGASLRRCARALLSRTSNKGKRSHASLSYRRQPLVYSHPTGAGTRRYTAPNSLPDGSMTCDAADGDRKEQGNVSR